MGWQGEEPWPCAASCGAIHGEGGATTPCLLHALELLPAKGAASLWSALVDLLRDTVNLFYRWTGNYGVSIIVLTISVRLLLLPLTLSQVRSLRKMQELQPELQRIQKKYKDDPQKLNEETLKLWREHKVSPLSGCLPVLIQLPILWALFKALNTLHFQGPASFLWIHNLAAPDPYYVLPGLAAVTTYWQSAISMPKASADPSQQAMYRTMTYVFPFFVAWISLTLPAGLALYWVISNLFSIGQQWLINRWDRGAQPRKVQEEPKEKAKARKGSKARKGEA